MTDKNYQDKINVIKDYKYYQQTDCPLPLIDKIQEEIADKLDCMFYPTFKGTGKTDNQLLLKNELMFVNNGIILFGRFNIFVVENNYYVKVLTPLDKFWLGIFKIIQDNIEIIVAVLSPYLETLRRFDNVDDIPYTIVDNTYNEIYNMNNLGKELSFVIPLTNRAPEIVELFHGFKCMLKATRESINTFRYKIVTMRDDETCDELVKEDMLPVNMLRTFLNNLYYNGELTTRPDYVASKL